MLLGLLGSSSYLQIGSAASGVKHQLCRVNYIFLTFYDESGSICLCTQHIWLSGAFCVFSICLGVKITCDLTLFKVVFIFEGLKIILMWAASKISAAIIETSTFITRSSE